MKQPTFHGRVLLPLSVFADARAGDPLAMERILRYYDGYMNKLCTRTLYDLDGFASCAGGRVHETPLAKQADPGHPKGQPMRKRRAQGQQAAASGAFSWVVFYAFRSVFWRDWIICPACPSTVPEKPCHGWFFTALNRVDNRYL